LDDKIKCFSRETKRPEYTLDMVKNMAKDVDNVIYSQVVGTPADELSRKTGTKRWKNLTTIGFGVT